LKLSILLQDCWNNDPENRPPFSKIIQEIRQIIEDLFQEVEFTSQRILSPDADYYITSSKVFSMAMGDGNDLWIGFSDGKIRIFDTKMKIWCKEFQAHLLNKRVYSIVKGTHDFESIICSGCEDGTINFWNTKNHELIQQLLTKGMVKSLLWIHPNLWILTTNGNESTVFRFNSKLQQIELQSLTIDQPSYCLLQLENNLWIGGYSKIFIVDIKMNSIIGTLDDDVRGINEMIYFEDHIWCANNSGFISVWNPQNLKKIHSLQDEGRKILSLCPIDDSTIVSGSSDGNISTWNTKDWTKLNTKKYHDDSIKCILVSEEGSGSFLWCGSLDKRISRSKLIPY